MTSKYGTQKITYAPPDGSSLHQSPVAPTRVSLGGYCSTVPWGACTFAHATRALPCTQQVSMAISPCPSMHDYSRKWLQALRRLHRAQALRRLRRVQALRRLRRVQLLRRLLPHWHLRRQLQRLKHPRWGCQKRQQLKHPRWRCQKLQLPQWRMLCPSRPSFRQQPQEQKHPLCHLPCHPPAHIPARFPARLSARLPEHIPVLPARHPRSRAQLQRLPQASFWTSPWLLLRHHLFPRSRERCPKLFPHHSGPCCYHCQATRLVR